jgi:hypothetical protein
MQLNGYNGMNRWESVPGLKLILGGGGKRHHFYNPKWGDQCLDCDGDAHLFRLGFMQPNKARTPAENGDLKRLWCGSNPRYLPWKDGERDETDLYLMSDILGITPEILEENEWMKRYLGLAYRVSTAIIIVMVIVMMSSVIGAYALVTKIRNGYQTYRSRKSMEIEADEEWIQLLRTMKEEE